MLRRSLASAGVVPPLPSEYAGKPPNQAVPGTSLGITPFSALAVRVRIANPAPLLAGGGVRPGLEWGLELPVTVARLCDLWGISGGGDPSMGSGQAPRHGIDGRAHGNGSERNC